MDRQDFSKVEGLSMGSQYHPRYPDASVISCYSIYLSYIIFCSRYIIIFRQFIKHQTKTMYKLKRSDLRFMKVEEQLNVFRVQYPLICTAYLPTACELNFFSFGDTFYRKPYEQQRLLLDPFYDWNYGAVWSFSTRIVPAIGRDAARYKYTLL